MSMHEAEEAGPIEERLGSRIRDLRVARRLSLAELGTRVGLSVSFLSQLERGLCNASFGNLRNIADALGVSLPDLVGDGRLGGERVVRKADRSMLLSGAARKYLMSLPPLDSIEIFLGEFDVGASSGDLPYSHGDSQEFLFVSRGSVVVEVDGKEYLLHEGDILEYRSSQLHRTYNAGEVLAEVLWIVSPVTVSAADLKVGHTGVNGRS